MKAVVAPRPLPIADPEALVDGTLPEPEAGPHDLLVDVRAVSVNPVDTKVRRRPFPEDRPRVLGWDAAGVVRAVGAEVRGFAPGDEVYYAGAIDRPGSNAERQVVDARIVGRKPRTLSFAEAAALPLTTITAWELLFDRLRIAPGKTPDPRTLLVTGAAGGVGSILVQLARRLTGLRVIATAGRPASVEWIRALGAHDVIDHTRPLDGELARIGVPQVEFIASLTHTEQHLDALLAAIAPQGGIALIDDPAAPIDIARFKVKSLSVHWEFMFARSLHRTADMAAQGRLLDDVASLVDAGALRTTLTENAGPIDAEHLRAVHARIERGEARGKIVLEGF